MAEKNIVWENITPRAPWEGGLYERLIGLTKTTMRRAIGRKLLAEREFVTLLAEVEGILNTRPLTYANFEDCIVIRPVDFIQPKASLALPSMRDEHDDYVPGKLDSKQKLFLACIGLFLVLDIHAERGIVLLDEPDTPRGLWKLAKIRELKKGKDGAVRAVVIEMASGRLLTKPINVLYPLEVEETYSMRDQQHVNTINEDDTRDRQSVNTMKEDDPIARRKRRAFAVGSVAKDEEQK
ncbi:unnamed protein product [Wuchereria bancrofti]|uniref:DUF5641 domain-containing protein n=1 Tax=Wuchereria bancrofti TaxID=6293 RepID=A0A3P7FVU2_WUCBA|nr:unnamed protein product [Wuchereria bancrofti]